MIRRLHFALMALAGFGVTWLAPTARADEWDKRTVMTFNEPFEIPGKVLPAGTYVFKLADDQSDRNIVQIFTEDQKQLVATILAVSDYREEPADKTIVTFEGGLRALRKRCIAGSTLVRTTVSNSSIAKRIARSSPRPHCKQLPRR